MKITKLVSNSICFAALTVTVSLTAGCGGGGGGTSDAVPTINNSRAVLPSSFSFEGGNMAVQADVSDDKGITSVQAVISKNGVAVATLPMQNLSGYTYKANWMAPSNPTTSLVTYTILITAKDTSNQTASSTLVSFNVPAVPSAPDPPTRAEE